MRLGIDASNLRAGGGVTHLVELLRAAQPQEHDFAQVIVWGGASTLARLEERSWLCKAHEPLLDRSLPIRLCWQRFMLDRRARLAHCAVLFAPGGSFGGTFRPFVTMSRNMLPFELSEARRYGCSRMFPHLMLLRWLQSNTFRSADGLIFLTRYARAGVLRTVKRPEGKTLTISHGVDARFLCQPRVQKGLDSYSGSKAYRILYVSIVNPYKHQWHVVEAVARLRRRGLPLQLHLVGPAWPAAMRRLRKAMRQHDPLGQFTYYHGPVPYAELPRQYREADAFVFASSCENLPNILLEAMASGLPIACSNRGPMPEVAGDAAVYFDPEDPVDIARAIEQLVVDPDLRARKAQAAFEQARLYSWQACAQETFRFLRTVANAAGLADSSGNRQSSDAVNVR